MCFPQKAGYAKLEVMESSGGVGRDKQTYTFSQKLDTERLLSNPAQHRSPSPAHSSCKIHRPSSYPFSLPDLPDLLACVGLYVPKSELGVLVTRAVDGVSTRA